MANGEIEAAVIKIEAELRALRREIQADVKAEVSELKSDIDRTRRESASGLEMIRYIVESDKDKIKGLETVHDKDIDEIEKDIEKLSKIVDDLLKFKWTIVGAVLAAGGVGAAIGKAVGS